MASHLMKTHESATTRRGLRSVHIALIGAASIGLLFATVSINAQAHLFLWNDSPSEPEGLYVRSGAVPAVGSLVAFLAPAAAFPYADRRLGYLHHTPVIKALAAGQGSAVCATAGQLTINGRRRASIVQTDRDGAQLPHWSQCRRLRQNEWFAFSDRVPNSFDSRYFGPITLDQVIGVYRPLWVNSKREG